MKKFLTLMLTAGLGLSSAAFAAPAVNTGKDSACTAFYAAAVAELSAPTRLDMALLVLLAANDIESTAEQKEKFVSYINLLVLQSPAKQNEIESAAYFACTTDLTAEDKEIAQKNFADIVSQ